MKNDQLIQVIRMARDAGMIWASGLNGSGYHINHPDNLQRFAALVAAAEREACCAIVYGQCGSDNVAARTVEAIRARSKT